MAANHPVTLSSEQRETLVSLTDTVVYRTDRFGNKVRIEITNWKNKRLHVNTSINGKRDESLWISLEDANDVKMTFNGDSNWLILEALINAEIARNVKAEAASEIAIEFIPSRDEDGNDLPLDENAEVVKIALPVEYKNAVNQVVYGGMVVDMGQVYGEMRYVFGCGGYGNQPMVTILRKDIPEFLKAVAIAKE